MRYVSLVRHGEYTPTPSGGKLTARGRRQAAATGKRLAKRSGSSRGRATDEPTPLDTPYTLYASTMSRAMESATIIGNHLSIDVRPGRDYLRESMPTGVPGHRVSLEARRKGRERVDAIVEKHLRPAPKPMHDVIVCHGNIIRAVVAVALGARLTTWLHMFIHHGSLTQLLVLEEGRVILRHYNDIGHFTPSLVTSSLTKKTGAQSSLGNGMKNGSKQSPRKKTKNPVKK